MNITVYDEQSGKTEMITINDFDELKMLTEAYFGIIPEDQLFRHNGNVLDLNKNLSESGLQSNDMVSISKLNQNNTQVNSIDQVKDQLMMDSYIPHTLIYVLAQTNNMGFRIIIDTGAAISIMCESAAKTLKIDHMIDTRLKGKVVGVGNSNILGSITGCNIKIGDNLFVPANFRVMEDSFEKYTVILGLDFLTSHKCKLDFVDRTIEVDGQSIRFLNEIEVENLKEPYNVVQKHLSDRLDTLKHTLQNKNDTIELFSKIANNIINNPTNDKFKTINTNGKMVQNLANDINPFLEFLKGLEFVPNKETPYRFTFKGTIENLKYVLNQI